MRFLVIRKADKATEAGAGFSILQVDSSEEAIEWVKRWPVIDGDGEVEIEIRQLFELGDFGPSEAIDRMRVLPQEVKLA